MSTFRYEGYTLQQLFGVAKTGTDQEKSDATHELDWRVWANAYTTSSPSDPYDIRDNGVAILPITCNPQQGRPTDREPKDPPPRPKAAGSGAGGGGGGSWRPVGSNGEYQLYFD